MPYNNFYANMPKGDDLINSLRELSFHLENVENLSYDLWNLRNELIKYENKKENIIGIHKPKNTITVALSVVFALFGLLFFATGDTFIFILLVGSIISYFYGKKTNRPFLKIIGLLLIIFFIYHFILFFANAFSSGIASGLYVLMFPVLGFCLIYFLSSQYTKKYNKKIDNINALAENKNNELYPVINEKSFELENEMQIVQLISYPWLDNNYINLEIIDKFIQYYEAGYDKLPAIIDHYEHEKKLDEIIDIQEQALEYQKTQVLLSKNIITKQEEIQRQIQIGNAIEIGNLLLNSSQLKQSKKINKNLEDLKIESKTRTNIFSNIERDIGSIKNKLGL